MHADWCWRTSRARRDLGHRRVPGAHQGRGRPSSGTLRRAGGLAGGVEPRWGGGLMGQPSRRAPVIDVHAHAMPRPLLRWLADLGLADVSDAVGEVIRLDARVSGVGDRVPLPLARSQHDVGVRLAEMDDVEVSHHAVSMPPFLFYSTAEDGGL